MARHFLNLAGAATLETEHYLLTRRAVDEVLEAGAMACGVRLFDRAANRALSHFRRADRVCAPHRPPTYPPRGSCASPNGLPSESLQIAHASPGWTTLPPSASTRSSASATSLTAK